MKLWSDLPAARGRELTSDVATAAWVSLWAVVGWQLFELLSSFARAGRLIRDGGVNLRVAGADIGAGMSELPFFGEGLGDIVTDSMASAASPFVDFGNDLETLIFLLAAVITALVVAVPLVPWLSRYLPWRARRVRRLNAADRVVRSPRASSEAVDRFLAARALYSLEYATLLQYSPDPMGDYEAGRHDRLARAELASVGLRQRR